MNVYKFFTNFDEEENWLNGMARQGCRLVKKGSFSYSFEPCEPENATIKVDYRSFKTWADYEDYVLLFADCGWQHIAGKKSSG
ncbi:DUF2812 domain-containing protein [Cohnella sp. 56]|uniref:DUF2812 domain-containing protein n=1 Tax=Cohnella sp. 56 TaxID=3113722 RepID=UPI0030E88F2C